MTHTRRTLAAVAAGIAVADVALIRTSHPTLSTCIRTNKMLRPLVVYLAAHLLFDLPFDPLHYVSRELRP